MSERPAPDLNHVREALRRLDDRPQDDDGEREAPPPEPQPDERDEESA